ncbi:RagB/SusD family nutrient uptake outer membrane protein [Runella sp. MFBS21]|uniref:RagB/SusD family nutrient uptake outer membrane protein n=1 Tax=Runella sp. MFBS21 TaxID=3034018 RepID=UPI0023F9999B|nr:RagB/SusD family nutrient uptake outer membrane protein [Runella sp. MFBS21]MDF7816443.1 RagB/SusD family nutrient uptake outer membrane protein [Runella sp. MFBS21]
MKKLFIHIFTVVTLISFTQCEKVLDKRDLTAIPEQAVWNDIALATAYVNQLYVDNMPTWPTNASGDSDESGGGGAYMFGQLTIDGVDYWPYNQIRNINVLLKNLGSGSLTKSQQDPLKGQALFLRAWQYFQLVSRYGGVPLVLEPQEITADLLVSRSKTSECIAQIIKDLDESASLLPVKWDNIDAGRITKGAVLAFKARILLHYASEQFNPTQLPERWTTAYAATKAAKEALEGAGHALFADFGKLWYTEGNANPEIILATRFINPGRTHNRDACTRPLDEAQNCTGANYPTISMVEAFPMKNGLSIKDPNSGYDATAFWLNRDPRFAATVAYNGSLWELSGKTGRTQWTFLGSQQTGNTNTGFYCRKAIFEGYKPNETELSGTDWIEIRFAEVLMNFAEAANEIGNPAEALDVLKAIRKRAGIEAGANGLYGLKANMSKTEMRQAILLERKIEFAFEGKRSADMRRRRLYDSELNGTKRKGYQINLIAFNGSKNDFFDAFAKGTIDLNKNYNTYFRNDVRDLDLTQSINFKPEYYFFAIPRTHLEKNANLKQTNGWDGGSFDPLQ